MVNADVMVWLAASPKDDAPQTAVVVNANTKSTLKASDLGDLKNPYLMIENTSAVNTAEFEIDIAGLKKEPKKEVKPVAKEENLLPLAVMLCKLHLKKGLFINHLILPPLPFQAVAFCLRKLIIAVP